LERSWPLYLPILVLRALLDDLELSQREVEENLDAGVQVGLHPHDRLDASAVLGAAGLEPLFLLTGRIQGKRRRPKSRQAEGRGGQGRAGATDDVAAIIEKLLVRVYHEQKICVLFLYFASISAYT
jgi:hypothetical protein